MKTKMFLLDIPLEKKKLKPRAMLLKSIKIKNSMYKPSIKKQVQSAYNDCKIH